MILAEFAAKLGLELDAKSFAEAERGIEAIRHGLGGLAIIAGAVGGALLGMIESTAHTGEEAAKTAQQIGISTDALQELQYAAKVSGLTAEDLTMGVRILSRQMQAAAQGSQEAGQSFARLGIRTADANGNLLSAQDVLEQVSDKFKDMPDGAEKTALAMQLFGRSGATLIPMLNKGADTLADFAGEARELGVVLDENTIQQSEEFHASQVRAEQAVVGLKNAIAGPLISALTPLLEGFTRWVAINRQLIATRVHQVAHALGVALKIVWLVVKPIVNLFAALASNTKVLTGIAIVLGIALLALAAEYAITGAAAIGAAIASAAAWLAAAAPVALLVALLAVVALAAEDIWVALHGGKSLIADIWAKWSGFVDKWSTSPTDGDNWLIAGLKNAVFTVTHFGEVWDYISGVLDVILAKIKAIVVAATGPLGFILDKYATISGKKTAERAAQTQADLSNATSDYQKALGAGFTADELNAITPEEYSQAGSFEAAAMQRRAASASAPNGGSIIPNPMSVMTLQPTFNVYQQPGEDNRSVVGHVQDMLSEFWDTSMRQAKNGI